MLIRSPRFFGLCLVAIGLGACSSTTEDTSSQSGASSSEPAGCRALLPAGAAPSLKLVTEGAYPPFNDFVDGQLVGWEMDYAKIVMEDLGIAYTMEKADWGDGCCEDDGRGGFVKPTAASSPLFGGVAEGTYDVAIAGVAITSRRTPVFPFSKPYGDVKHEHWFVSQPGHTFGGASAEIDLTSGTGLDGVTVAVQTGTAHAAYLAARYPKAVIVGTATEAEALQKVLDGATILKLGSSDSPELQTALEQRRLVHGPNLNETDQAGHDLFYGPGTGFVVRPTLDPKIREAIECVVERRSKDAPMYENLNQKWETTVLPAGTPGLHGG